MLVLSAADVEALLPMAEAIEVVDAAMRALSGGKAGAPLRTVMPVGAGVGTKPGAGGIMGVMPATLAPPGGFGVKVVTLFPGNPARGLPAHHGGVMLFDGTTGAPVALVEAGTLTAIRTAAASAVATRRLASGGAGVLALIGTGEQAHRHLAAMLAVRPVRRVRVAGRSGDAVGRFLDRARQAHPGLDIVAAPARDAVAGADIVCTVTGSRQPVLCGDWLCPGAHVNAVGATGRDRRELDDAALLRASVWVDHLASALAETGDLGPMLEAGTLPANQVKGEIGACLSGDIPGRTTAEEITLYRSVGHAVQDLAAVTHVLDRARRDGRGTVVAF